MNLGLVQYDCGCIGWPKGKNGKAVIIDRCDRREGENDRLNLEERDMSHKSHAPLPETLGGQTTVAKTLQTMLVEAERFKTIQLALQNH